MEKFLLGTFLSYNELDIINKKDVIIAVFFTEFRGGNVVFVTDRIDQLVGKGFRPPFAYLASAEGAAPLA